MKTPLVLQWCLATKKSTLKVLLIFLATRCKNYIALTAAANLETLREAVFL